MKSKNALAVLFTTGLLAFTGVATAGEKPPVGAKPLSEILKVIEAQGYAPITEVSIEHGVWEIEAYKVDKKRELKVSPTDGKIISDRPDD